MYPWSIDQLHFSFMVYNLDSVKFTRLMPGHILLLFTSVCICLVALWLYTIVVILTKQKFSVGCVMELAIQLTHNSRSSIGYQTVTNAHMNKGVKGSNSLL